MIRQTEAHDSRVVYKTNVRGIVGLVRVGYHRFDCRVGYVCVVPSYGERRIGEWLQLCQCRGMHGIRLG
jgi:hypothetical protein